MCVYIYIYIYIYIYRKEERDQTSVWKLLKQLELRRITKSEEKIEEKRKANENEGNI